MKRQNRVYRHLSNCFFLIVLFSAFTLGATITVTNTNDSGAGSLRKAIADATPGSTINFDLGFATPKTITMTSGQLVIDKNLTIHGPGASLLSISGNNASRVFYIKYVNTGILTVALDGMTIKEAYGSRGFDSDSEYGGGAIFNGGILTVGNCTINENAAVGVNGNDGGLGGGIYNLVTLAVNGSIVSSNTANGYGGGGGIYNLGALTIDNSAVSGNSTSGWGGGIYNAAGTLTVNNSIISGNGSNMGGGILNEASLNITTTTVSGNAGDGIYAYGGLNVKVNNSTVSGNEGDGIVNFGSTLTVNNSTVSGNAGAGVENEAFILCSDPEFSVNARAYFTNATISGNTGEGILNFVGRSDFCDYPYSAYAYLVNSIISANNGEIVLLDGSTIGNANHSLIGDAGTSGGIVNGVNGNIVGVNPMLGPLRNNGGPTMTHALLAGSPAINAGDNAFSIGSTDQRGFPRIFGGIVDIGAFEHSSASISGRVRPPDGKGLKNASVSMVDSIGVRRTVLTSSFGYYIFHGVATGQTYTMSVQSNRYRFLTRQLQVDAALMNVDFVGFECSSQQADKLRGCEP